MGTVLFGNFISDDHARIQAKDHADIVISFIQFEAGNVTDPGLVWLRHLKLLQNHIFLGLFNFSQSCFVTVRMLYHSLFLKL